MPVSKEGLPSLDKVIRRKAEKAEFETVDTSIPGVAIKIEKGNKPRILKQALGQLAVTGKLFARRKARIYDLEKQQKEPEAEIKGMAAKHRGFRGISSETDNYQIGVDPRHKVTWNRGVLKDALGVAYPSVVGEDVIFKVSVPIGVSTNTGPLTSEMTVQALHQGLTTLGFTQEQLPNIVSSEIAISVDEARLGRMVMDGQVVLPEEAGEVSESWAITAGPHKPSK